MKFLLSFKWDKYYDWMIIPTIMIGFRPYAIGAAFLFLKLKIELKFYWREKTLDDIIDYDL